MLSKACSAAVNGIAAFPVEVAVNAGNGDTLRVMIATNTAQIHRGNRWHQIGPSDDSMTRFAQYPRRFTHFYPLGEVHG
jgi:hypothetical protein